MHTLRVLSLKFQCPTQGAHFWEPDGGCYAHYSRGPCEKGELFLPGGKCGCEAHLPHYHNETASCYELGKTTVFWTVPKPLLKHKTTRQTHLFFLELQLQTVALCSVFQIRYKKQLLKAGCTLHKTSYLPEKNRDDLKIPRSSIRLRSDKRSNNGITQA